jgi:hypothetical protein
MSKSKNTQKFLDSVPAKTRTAILSNIANHYGITNAQALEEVTDVDAEHLLDYVTGPEREDFSLFMKMSGLRGF